MTRAHVWAVAAPIAVGIALLGLWQFAVTSSDVPAYLVPSPLLIARTLGKDWPVLAPALLTTVRIAAIALSLSVVAGVATGFLFVQSRAIEASLMPYAVLLQVTPIVAVAPLIIIWVDDPATALVACATIVALFPMVSSTTLGLKSVDPGLRDLFRLYGASRWQVFVRLRVPSALPFFFSGLRISAGLALIGAVVAEFVAGTGGTSSGLAYQILMAGLQLNIPRMFAALLLIALAGIAFYVLASVFAWLALHRWHDSAR